MNVVANELGKIFNENKSLVVEQGEISVFHTKGDENEWNY